jgi:hypothetical protein
MFALATFPSPRFQVGGCNHARIPAVNQHREKKVRGGSGVNY